MAVPTFFRRKARFGSRCQSHPKGQNNDLRVRLALDLLEDRTLLSSGLKQPLAALSYSETEVVAAVKSSQPLAALAEAFQTPGGRQLASAISLSASYALPSLPGDTLVQLGLVQGTDPLAAVAELEKLSIVSWAAPNYVYDAATLGDPRELTPNDPSYGSQYHHTLMKNNLAWDHTLGRASIVVAITDDGTDLAHVDLYDNIWINQGEIPSAYRSNLSDIDADGIITLRDLNNPINKGPFKSNDVNGNSRIDALDLIAGANGGGTAGWSDGTNNDANGYTDDIVGWDFSAGDLNPNNGTDNNHGTHVAGITAAHTNNAVGVAGTAGNATIMPIRFYGTGSWTSTVIYNSYAYAANNGAKILSTSYNVDGFTDDPSFGAALNYMYGKGVLHFNSAGNNGENNSPRTKHDHTLFVVATDAQDKKASFSNYGFRTDVSAPGVSIYSTYPTNSYATNSGTSMAAPNAAGVAALIWSMHPTWTRDQVAAQLLGTADNINAQNPAYANLLGAGRVNALRAVTETLAPPKFDAVIGLPAENGTHFGRLLSFEIEVGSVFSASSMMNPANWQLRWAGPDGVFNTGDDKFKALTLATNYMVGTNRFKFTMSGRTPAGLYQFKAVSGGLVNPFGTPLDGDGNGVGGDHFVRNFFVNVGNLPAPPGGPSATGLSTPSDKRHTLAPINANKPEAISLAARASLIESDNQGADKAAVTTAARAATLQQPSRPFLDTNQLQLDIDP